MDYFAHVLVLLAIFVTLAKSLDIVVGQLGILSVAHAAFWGLGAYTTAILVSRAVLPVVALGVAMGVAVAASLAVSACAIRLQGDYFVMATFAFQVVVHDLFLNWISVTGGASGITGIPPIRIAGLSIDTPSTFGVFATCVALLTYVLLDRIGQAPFTRVLRAVRDDQPFAESLGKAPPHYKARAIAVGAAGAAVAGWLFSLYFGYVGPSTFTVFDSILLVSTVIIGGADSRWGPLLGALIAVGMPELLRFVGLPDVQAAALRQILFGLMLILLMFVRPRGLTGRYAFD